MSSGKVELNLLTAILLSFTLSLPLLTFQKNPVRLYPVTITPVRPDILRLQAVWERVLSLGSGACVHLCARPA